MDVNAVQIVFNISGNDSNKPEGFQAERLKENIKYRICLGIWTAVVINRVITTHL